MTEIQDEFFLRAGDLAIYVRFVAVLVLLLAVIQLWQAVRDARYLVLLVWGLVGVLAGMSLSDPSIVVDRLP